MPLEGHVERRDVVSDVVAHDDAVRQIVQEPLERHGLVHAFEALVSRHAVDGHGLGIAFDLDQRVERVFEHDLRVAHGDRADGDDAIRAWIEAGGFRVEHDEAHAIDGRVIGPRRIEMREVPLDERRAAHRRSIHPRSPVNSINRRMARNPPLSRWRSWRLSKAGGSSEPDVP